MLMLVKAREKSKTMEQCRAGNLTLDRCCFERHKITFFEARSTWV